jgi:hypothetical protein
MRTKAPEVNCKMKTFHELKFCSLKSNYMSACDDERVLLGIHLSA